MCTLYLDLASHDGLIAAVADDRIAASASVDHRTDDAQLMPIVESILKKAGWSYQDLTQIACVVGPGGFTSLRVAVALANTLSHELKIPACGIHLSDIYQSRKCATGLWVHSTKKNELFIRESTEEPRCITVDEFKKILKKGMQWMGELIPEHRKIADEAGATEAPLQPLANVLSEFLREQKFDHQTLQPWYGRGW